MTREEFCDLMAEAKKKSGVRVSYISFQMQMLLSTLRRLERGKHSFSMKKCLEYLATIKSELVLDQTVVHNYDELVQILVSARKPEYSQRTLADKIGMSFVGVSNMERKKSIASVDMFLAIADVVGLTISINTHD